MSEEWTVVAVQAGPTALNPRNGRAGPQKERSAWWDGDHDLTSEKAKTRTTTDTSSGLPCCRLGCSFLVFLAAGWAHCRAESPHDLPTARTLFRFT